MDAALQGILVVDKPLGMTSIPFDDWTLEPAFDGHRAWIPANGLLAVPAGGGPVRVFRPASIRARDTGEWWARLSPGANELWILVGAERTVYRYRLPADPIPAATRPG